MGSCHLPSGAAEILEILVTRIPRISEEFRIEHNNNRRRIPRIPFGLLRAHNNNRRRIPRI